MSSGFSPRCRDLSQPRRRVTLARRKLTLPRRKLTLARRRLTLARRRLTLARRKLALARRRLALARRKLTLPRRKLTLPRRKLALAWRRLALNDGERGYGQTALPPLHRLLKRSLSPGAFNSIPSTFLVLPLRTANTKHNLPLFEKSSRGTGGGRGRQSAYFDCGGRAQRRHRFGWSFARHQPKRRRCRRSP